MNTELIKRLKSRSRLDAKALNDWRPEIVAAAKDDRSISIYDVIGEDWYDEGVTAARVAGILRMLGDGDVVVNINSPGGDMFEGIAIYHLLKEHKGHVTVNVIGMAASAASVIAMAGDTVNIGKAAFLMIHNCWTMAIGNSQEFTELAAVMDQFDKAMLSVYEDKTGLPADEIKSMIDAETWLSGEESINAGFADSLLPSDKTKEQESVYTSSVRKVESALRASGMPRSHAQKLIAELKSSASDSAGSSERDATERNLSESVDPLLAALTSFKL